MKQQRVIIALFLISVISACTPKSQYVTKTATDPNGYKYTYVTNDPYNLRIYTLKNGLTAYLSLNTDEPRIQTFIPVKAGSSYDPADNTGLAHYLEHMMFKGTSKIGTINWDEEKKLIDQISSLYEQHKAETNIQNKKLIYSKIDSLSNLAAQYVAPNEYEKLITSIGGSELNAYTTNERTVYMCNIPSNEVEKWLQIESERFFNPVLRIFHTELETVYEEFNMGQDSDRSKTYEKIMSLLFPNHPYGQQTTIGKAEHLKNPSMVNILKYQHKYYVPNNMAICLSGDLDYEKTIQLIDKYFGQKQANNIEPKKMPVEKPIDTIIRANVYGPQSEFLYLGYRFNGVNSNDQKMVTLIDYMLNNSKAGLFDLHLNQQQKVLRSASFNNFLKDYGMHVLYGMPRQGQTLEDVENLLISELDNIKKGNFDDDLILSCINDLKLNNIREQENNDRAHTFAISFANGSNWQDELKFNSELEKITKQQVIDYANKNYNNNYIVVYKRNGADTTVVKVDKPKITPVTLNRDNESDFSKNLKASQSERLKPVFLDFEKQIETRQLTQDIKFRYIKNPSNDLFKLTYIVDMGKNHNKKLSLAIDYLPYLGTNKYTAAQLQKEFFKYGLSFGVSTSDNRSYVYIEGLEQNAATAINLLEHILANAKADTLAYKKFIEGITKKRANNKLEPNYILRRAMMNYAMYGPSSSFTDILQQNEMEQINPDELTGYISQLTSYKHQVFYYGKKNIDEAFDLVQKNHVIPQKINELPVEKTYQQLDIKKPIVYFTNYDMVQAYVLRLTKGTLLQNQLAPQILLFNDYYGSGLSSIVFQEIRESRGGVYSAYSAFTTPDKPDKAHYNYSFIATQPDKIDELLTHFNSILNNMPEAKTQFDNTKESLMKQIETSRIIKDNIFWTYIDATEKGIDYDEREFVYNYLKDADIQKFKEFFNQHVSNKNAVYLVLGNKKAVNFNTLKKFGDVKELSLDEIFNY